MDLQTRVKTCLAPSPLHGEGVFALAAIETGDVAFDYLDSAMGLAPPLYKLNSSAVMERPPASVSQPELDHIVASYKEKAHLLANGSGCIAKRAIAVGEELLYAYCPLHWLVMYIDAERNLESRKAYVRVLAREKNDPNPGVQSLHKMNLKRLGCGSWEEVLQKMTEDPTFKVGF